MLERNFFTQRRKEHLDIWPELETVEKYGQYCLVPLDIPRFDNPLLVKWFFDHCEPTYKISKDIANNRTGVTNFDAIDVLPTNETDQQDIWTLNIQQSFMTDFKDVYDQIMEYFPFKSLTRIRLWSSTRNVLFHRDHTKFVDFPGAFRIMLYDENPEQTLSLIPSLPDSPDDLSKKFSIPRLDNTNSYTWNNLRTKHGSDFIPGFRKIIIILDRYEIDIERYKNLLDRSIKIYQENCLTSVRNKNEYLL